MVSIVPRELYALLEEPAGAKAADEEVKDMEFALMIIQRLQA